MFVVATGDCLNLIKARASDSVQCCVTSPPYFGLRNYGSKEQIGIEKTPEEYISKLVEVFSEVRRVLKPNGALWLNIGDTYATNGGSGKQGKTGARANRTHTQEGIQKTAGNGIKAKELIGIPWMLALALRKDGWMIRQEIVWYKRNGKPESVKDRCTRNHEFIFMLVKSSNYLWNFEAMQEEASGTGGGACFGKQNISTEGTGAKQRTYDRPEYATRNKRSVWDVTAKPFKDAHFATFPVDLIEPCILATTNKGDLVLDPFCGSGTTGVASVKYDRLFLGMDCNQDYCDMSYRRIEKAIEERKAVESNERS